MKVPELSSLIANRSMGILIVLTFLAMTIGTAPLTITALTTLCIWILTGSCWRNRHDWLASDWLVPLLLIILLPWIAMLWSEAPNHKFNFAIRSYYWLFALISATWLRDRTTLRKVVIVYIAGMLITSFIVLLYSFSITPTALFMGGIIRIGYITYSLQLVVALLLLAYLFQQSANHLSKLAILIGIILLAITITRLNGRGGYLSLLLFSPWIAISMLGKQRALSVICVLGTVMLLLFSSAQVQQRVLLIPEQAKRYLSGDRTDTPIGARIEMIQDAKEVIARHPLFGAGTAGLWHETNLKRPGHGINHPHNSYLYILANYGITGFIIYAWLIFLVLKRAWPARRTLAGHTVLSFLLVIMIGSLTDTQFLSLATGVALGFVVGIPTEPSSECAS